MKSTFVISSHMRFVFKEFRGVPLGRTLGACLGAVGCKFSNWLGSCLVVGCKSSVPSASCLVVGCKSSNRLGACLVVGWGLV